MPPRQRIHLDGVPLHIVQRPLEAIESYLAANPRQLVADAARESKFGCTFAFRGYYKVAAVC